MAVISRKKIVYPIRESLRKYLVKYGREVDIPIHYKELLRYTNSIAFMISKAMTRYGKLYFMMNQTEMKSIIK
jgi:hypothetical protein